MSLLQATGVFGAMLSLPTLGHDFSLIYGLSSDNYIC